MRKSKAVRLALLGTTSLALASCDDAPPQDGKFFRTLAECTAVLPESECRDGLAKSQAAAAVEAPRFARQQECESEFGASNCEVRSADGGGSFFMPMLMGYMLGSAFSKPVFRGPNNSAVVQNGGKLFNVGSFAGAGRAAGFQSGQIAQVKRGGFGRTATAHRSSAGS